MQIDKFLLNCIFCTNIGVAKFCVLLYLGSFRKNTSFSNLYLLYFKCSKLYVQNLFFCFLFSFKKQGSLQTEFSWTFSNKDLKISLGSLIINWENWSIFIIRFEQLRESSGSLKTINTLESFKIFMKSLHNFMAIMEYRTIMLNDSLFHYRNL